MIKLGRRLTYAARGLRYVITSQSSFRLELGLFIAASLVGWYLNFSSTAWMILIIMSALVLIMEISNTVWEKILDLIEPRLSAQVALLKDIQAGIVLLLVAAAVLVGALLVAEHLP